MKLALAEVIATWFYIGTVPKAPGTAGALAGVLLVFLLHRYAFFVNVHFALLALVLLPAMVWASSYLCGAMGLKDPQLIVADEVLGQIIAFAPVTLFNAWDYLAAFVLFRTFDIWKPFPVNLLEKLPKGWGVMMDDVMAGLYAALVIYIGQNFLNLPL
jgi:phosphatidylglycerophosphatase A